MISITLSVGDVVASREPVILGTILGSCVSVCLYDEQSSIGGMNHFLLPGMSKGVKNLLYCGPDSIKRLVDKVQNMGADVRNIRAKVFGGGRVIKEFSEEFNIGQKNVMTAKEILSNYGIPIIREFTCPDYGIKLIFHTATGRAFVKQLYDGDLRSWGEKSTLPCSVLNLQARGPC
ncbi:MAG: chemotaxis protein CheD [Nitrospirae bacterium]|nr:chemotaxis protein CheD [Nitrospirota bacterium]